MSTDSQRFDEALRRFDAENARDPNIEQVGDRRQPKELLYAQRMTQRLDRFAPEASEPLRLAARCQHICRWTIPRGDYPEGRTGYLKWRTALKHFHADKAAGILREVGYDEETIARVQSLVRKERIKKDPEAQALEDVICLVFLEHYFQDFARQHDDEKLVDILRKTWKKMSPAGHAAALELDLPGRARELVEKALAG